jgi:SAM-dependent methyltransferase
MMADREPDKAKDFEQNMDTALNKFHPHIKALNLGCGFVRMRGATNVDKYAICKPDLIWDLDEFPYPFDDNSYDVIYMDNVLEHLNDWWSAIRECSRILKIGGWLLVFVPDASSTHALAYKDHLHVFSVVSFHNFISGSCDRTGTNAFAKHEIETEGIIPLRLAYYKRIPHKRFNWMSRWCPWLLNFCGNHMMNFIKEQHIAFEKMGPESLPRTTKPKFYDMNEVKANLIRAENRPVGRQI